MPVTTKDIDEESESYYGPSRPPTPIQNETQKNKRPLSESSSDTSSSSSSSSSSSESSQLPIQKKKKSKLESQKKKRKIKNETSLRNMLQTYETRLEAHRILLNEENKSKKSPGPWKTVKKASETEAWKGMEKRKREWDAATPNPEESDENVKSTSKDERSGSRGRKKKRRNRKRRTSSSGSNSISDARSDNSDSPAPPREIRYKHLGTKRSKVLNKSLKKKWRRSRSRSRSRSYSASDSDGIFVEGSVKDKERLFMEHLPELTRMARRVWIGGLSTNEDLTTTRINEIFTAFCPHAGIRTRNPIVNVYISPDRKWATLEFRSIADAKKARENLHGYELNGRRIQANFMSGYVPVPRWLRKYFIGKRPKFLPKSLELEKWSMDVFRIAASMTVDFCFSIDWETGEILGNKQAETRKGANENAFIPLPGQGGLDVQLENPESTRAISIKNLIRFEEIKQFGNARLIRETKMELAVFGGILEVCIPKPGDREAGKVFVKFKRVEHSIKCKNQLDGQFYKNRQLVIKFIPEDTFDYKRRIQI